MIAEARHSLSIAKPLAEEETSTDNQSTLCTLGLHQISLADQLLTESSDGYCSQQQTPSHIPHSVKNVSRNIPEFVPKIASNWLFYDDISPLSRRPPPAQGTLAISIPQLNYRLNCEKFIGLMPAKSCSSELLISTPHSIASPVNELWLKRANMKNECQFKAEQEFEGLLVSTSAPNVSISKSNEIFHVVVQAGSDESVTLLHYKFQTVGRISVKRDEVYTPLFGGFLVQETRIGEEKIEVIIRKEGSKFGSITIETSALDF